MKTKPTKPGRPRPDSKLPDYVYFRQGRYAFIPYLGRGKRGKEISLKLDGALLREDATASQIYRAYDLLQERNENSLKWLLEEFLGSAHFKSLKPTTQSGYETYKDVICRKRLKDGSTFGDLPYSAITIKTVRRYLDSRAAKTGGNREVQFLKSAFSWAMQYIDGVDSNPCVGVTLNKEKPRDRYITHDEFDQVREIARKSSYPYVAIAMELAYLCRARRGEVYNLKRSDLLEDGLFLERGKGSDSEITLWNPRLHKVVSDAKTFNPDAPSLVSGSYLLHDKHGLAFTKNALDTAWQRVMADSMKQGVVREKFTFHDIKAKGISDHKHKHGGHRSGRMKRVYDRLPDLIKPTK